MGCGASSAASAQAPSAKIQDSEPAALNQFPASVHQSQNAESIPAPIKEITPVSPAHNVGWKQSSEETPAATTVDIPVPEVPQISQGPRACVVSVQGFTIFVDAKSFAVPQTEFCKFWAFHVVTSSFNRGSVLRSQRQLSAILSMLTSYKCSGLTFSFRHTQDSRRNAPGSCPVPGLVSERHL